MTEIEALIQKAKDSLGAARGLLRDGYPDFAASRGYYAMFYVAEALLAVLGQSYRSHSAVISAFGREFAKRNRVDRKFHQWLIAAQNYRNLGDYGIESHVSEQSVQSVCAWAEEFIQAAEDYIGKQGGIS